jgi:DNA-binding NarL/FixJ family response regulator
MTEPISDTFVQYWEEGRDCRSSAKPQMVRGRSKTQHLKPDLILLDIRLPTLNGIEVSKRISRVVPHAKIVFVTQEADPDVVRAVLDHSPRGYVLKLDTNSELLPAVDAVLEGKQFVSTGVKARR